MHISIITINLNNSEGLDETIKSVINQDFIDFEYIIVDGGSTDSSFDIINKHRAHIDSVIIENDDGIYDAMNKGISISNSPFLMFLNSGDTLATTDVLAIGYTYMQAHPNVDLFYGDIFFKNRSSTNVIGHKNPPLIDVTYFQNHQLNHQSSFFKASLFKEFGNYPDKYRWAGDHWLYLKSYVFGKTFMHMDYMMVVYDTEGLSYINKNLYLQEAATIWEELVPGYVKEIIVELNIQRRIYGFKLVKIAHFISEKLAKVRGRT